MASRKLTDPRIRYCIEVLDAFAQSGQCMTAFAQMQDMSYAQLRGWQAHCARWRSQRAVQLPSDQPAQAPHQQKVQNPLANRPLACDFIEAQVVPARANPRPRRWTTRSGAGMR